MREMWRKSRNSAPVPLRGSVVRNQLANACQLAVHSAAGQQCIAIDAELAVRSTRQVKAEIEIACPACTFQFRADEALIPHEEEEVIAAVGLDASDTCDR